MRALLALAALLISVLGAAAQPGPTPDPWVFVGNALGYSGGGVVLPTTVTGGDKGVGTVNVSGGYYINGVAISGSLTSVNPPLSASAGVVSLNIGTGLANSGGNLVLSPSSAGTIGGVNSIAFVASNFVSFIDTSGLPHLAQPAFSDIAGTNPVARGGTACSVASGTCLDNITGFAGTGIMRRSGAGSYSFGTTISVPEGGTGQTTFTSGLPLLGNGSSALSQGTISGSGTVFATVTGTPVNGNCASWSGGNVIDAGGPCTTGGGGGTVSAGTAGQLTYYATSSTTVAGNANFTVASGAMTFGVAGSVAGQVKLSGATGGTTTLQSLASASGVLTLPSLTDTIVTKTSTDVLTNKSLDTAGAGNVLKVNGTTLSAVTGTGSVALSDSPTFTTQIVTPQVTGGGATNSALNLYATTNGSPSGETVNLHAAVITLARDTVGGSTVNIGKSGVTGGILTVAGGASGFTTILAASIAGAGTITLPTTGQVYSDAYNATAANIWQGSTPVVVTGNSIALAAAFVSISYSATTTFDFSTFTNGNIGLTGNVTFANPTNAVPGYSGCIWISQDATGSRIATWGSAWVTPGGVAAGLVLSTTPSVTDLLCYEVRLTNVIVATLQKNVTH